MIRSLLRREPSHGRRLPGPGRAALGATLLALLAVAPPTPAQSTWTNPAGGNWSAGSNWLGGIAPTPGTATALVFGSSATQAATYTATNDLANPFILNRLTITNTAGTVTLAGSGMSFAGSNPTLSLDGAGSAVLSTAVALAATTTVAGTGPVIFNGAVTGGTNNLVKTSAGPLTMSGGGTLNALQLAAGTTNVTGGTLALTLPDTTTASLLLGTAAGQTIALNQTGGRINVTENARIGEAAGSTATVTVTGAGTVLDNTLAGTTGLVRVGNNGAGTLNVTAGGVVNALNLYIGVSAGGTGDMVIDGAGSTVNSSFMFRVGNAGTGTLTVRNGGTLNAGTVSAQFALIVGNVGVGTLTVRDGGAVNTPILFIGYGGTGGVPGTGTTTVTGAGSTLTVGTPTALHALYVGVTQAGNGTFNVQNGGLVTVNGDVHGAYFDGRGTINVTDAGSLLNVTGRLSLGGDFSDAPGTATLNIGSGGTVTVAGRAGLQNAAAINLNVGGVLSVGSLADGPRNGTGAVNLAAGTTLTLTGSTTTFSGAIAGAGGLALTGPGVQALAGANTYTGNTTVSAGTLQLTGNGSFAASRRITVGTAAGSSAVLDVSGVTGGANFGNGGFALAANQTLAGHGSIVGPVAVGGGAAVAPGTGVGTLTAADMIWRGGGRYDFEFSGAAGDLVNGTGQLALGALNSSSRFTVNIQSFDPALVGPQTYTIATFAGGVTGFDPAAGNPQFTFTGLFIPGSASLALAGNNLILTFTPVPEPAHGLLLCAAAAGAVRWRRRRRRAVLYPRGWNWQWMAWRRSRSTWV
jgi:T5SS/PEP-CTERM-associated repeat protein/autotransporter-associated beta strand protein